MDGGDTIVRRVANNRRRSSKNATPRKTPNKNSPVMQSRAKLKQSTQQRNGRGTSQAVKKDWGFTNSFNAADDINMKSAVASSLGENDLPVCKRTRHHTSSPSDNNAKSRSRTSSRSKRTLLKVTDITSVPMSPSGVFASMSDTSFNENDLLAIASIEQEHLSQLSEPDTNCCDQSLHQETKPSELSTNKTHKPLQQNDHNNAKVKSIESKSTPQTKGSSSGNARTNNSIPDSSKVNLSEASLDMSGRKTPISLHDKLIKSLRNNVVTPTSTRVQQLREAHVQSVMDEAKALYEDSPDKDLGPFYGLPSKVKQLFERQRGISKLYAWQDECLSLDAIKQRTNLIYSLPTSGGKTLVAEILILREMLCQQRDALLILPFVSIVQEKVRGLAGFGVDLDFLVEEYAASKGRIPPLKRRKRKSLYIATIEKANSLINSLIEEKRMQDVGLVVVDELHMLGEGGSRGATLEVSLAKVMHSSRNTHIVGMSATLNNIRDLQVFLKAEVYTNDFRPVKLREFVKMEDVIYEVNASALCPEDEITQSRCVTFPYDKASLKLDPDHLTGLVSEVIPQHSCLVFCPTKKNCENVATLICQMMPRIEETPLRPLTCCYCDATSVIGRASLAELFKIKELTEVKQAERNILFSNLLRDGNGEICPVLRRTIAYGVAYHHSGLTMDERKLIEEAYSDGTLCLLTCTSTLAAGVNLPAKRVILRAPYVGASFLHKSQYKQMIGRAGRAGIDTSGESILILKKADKTKLKDLISGPYDFCRSSLLYEDRKGIRSLLLNVIGLQIADSVESVLTFMAGTLFSVQSSHLKINIAELTHNALQRLLDLGMIVYKSTESQTHSQALQVTSLGRATYKGSVDVDRGPQLYADLCTAQQSLVVANYLHLLYLVTPYDMVTHVKPDWMVLFNQISCFDESELKVASLIGLSESYVARRASGQRIKQKVDESVSSRFYLTLMLYDLWKQKSIWEVSHKYRQPRGFIQNLLNSAASFAACVAHFCQEMEEFWAYQDLLSNFVMKLSYCVTTELIPLMEITGVKQGRAKQLYNAGFRNLTMVAHADEDKLVRKIEHLTHKAANQIIASAKMLLQEKAEKLREEVEELTAIPVKLADSPPGVSTNKLTKE